MEAVKETKTVLRVRTAHVHTLKDGWRLSETTVEATGTEINHEDIREQMRLAYNDGLEETKRRNKLERDYNRGVAPGGNSDG